MKARSRAVGDFFAALGGTRLDLLARDPGSRTRQVTMGGVVASTGLLAAISMAFALNFAVHAPWPVAVPLGVLWGLIIVNLDRLLIAGMRHGTSGPRTLLLAVPRVLLAVILGLVIATPLTLQIFRSEVDTEITEIHLEQAAATREQLDNDPRFAELDDLEQRIEANEQIVATAGRADPALAPVYADVQAKQAAYDREEELYRQLQAEAIAEGDGRGGTRTPGHGEQWEEKVAAAAEQRQKADQALAALTAAQQAAADAEAAAVIQAQSAIARDRPLFDQLTADRNALQALHDAENSDNTGLLIRLEALSRITADNSTLGLARLALDLLFIAIELLPVLNKVLLNLGKPSAYDELLELENQAAIDKATFDRQTTRTLAREEADSALAIGRDRIARQQKTALKVNADVVRQQQRIVTQALAVWGEHTEQVAGDQLAAYQADLQARRAVEDPAPFVAGTPDWTMSGAPSRPREPVAPWSNPPGPRTPDAAPDIDAEPTTANFTVDPATGTYRPVTPLGSRQSGRPNGSPFIATADLPSADDL
ncbi:DUF4407 domain-containing protein [Geodermatophilus sp. SYSU D01180]